MSHPRLAAFQSSMLKQVFYTSVLVSDQDRALDFYINVLGLEKRVENPTPDGPRFLTVGGARGPLPTRPVARDPGRGRAGHGPPPGVGHDRDRRLPRDGRGADRAR